MSLLFQTSVKCISLWDSPLPGLLTAPPPRSWDRVLGKEPGPCGPEPAPAAPPTRHLCRDPQEANSVTSAAWKTEHARGRWISEKSPSYHPYDGRTVYSTGPRFPSPDLGCCPWKSWEVAVLMVTPDVCFVESVGRVPASVSIPLHRAYSGGLEGAHPPRRAPGFRGRCGLPGTTWSDPQGVPLGQQRPSRDTPVDALSAWSWAGRNVPCSCLSR